MNNTKFNLLNEEYLNNMNEENESTDDLVNRKYLVEFGYFLIDQDGGERGHRGEIDEKFPFDDVEDLLKELNIDYDLESLNIGDEEEFGWVDDELQPNNLIKEFYLTLERVN